MTIKKYTKPQEKLFIVRRTSKQGGKPCDEAFEAEIMRVDSRNTDDPKKILVYGGTEGWYKHGSNHRLENGRICRDIFDKVYVIELDSITNIMNFIDKYGECIIDRDRGFCTIEIYDNYRE